VIYTYRHDHERLLRRAAGFERIDVNYDWTFELADAKEWLDLSRLVDVVFVTQGYWWWEKHRSFAQLCDFLTYRGAQIFHTIGPFNVAHSSYTNGDNGRFSKLYNERTLDAWAQA
jgi:hypothetical protein